MKKPNFFQRLFGLAKNWYDLFFEKLEDKGLAGVEATNWLKEKLENGDAEAIAYYTPTTKDDELVAKAKLNLVPLLAKYAEINGLFIEGKSRLQIVQTVFDYITSKKSKRSFWVEISGDLIVFLADGKIDWNEALILGQKIFWQIFNKKKKLAIAA